MIEHNFKSNIFRKRFDNYTDGIELFKKIQSGEIRTASKRTAEYI